jgi:hypothetical protein
MNSRVARFSTYALGVMTIILSIPSGVLAGTPFRSPEVDPSSISAAVGVVAAAVLILRARRGLK